MAESRHLAKLNNGQYLRNGLTDGHEIWQSAADWPSELYQQLKLQTFENSRWRMAALFKIERQPCLANGLSSRREIWHGDKCWPSECELAVTGSWNFKLWKISDGRWSHCEKFLKTAIYRQWFDRLSQNLAWWRILIRCTLSAVKNLNSEKSKMADRRHFDYS